MRPGPLFSITGASGSGKSTVCKLLRPELPDCVPLDGDALWRDELWGDDGEWHYGAWLRLAAEIGAAGRNPAASAAAVAAWVRERL